MQPKTKHKELWQLISEKEMFKKKRFEQKPNRDRRIKKEREERY
jgi:hypothetical protein